MYFYKQAYLNYDLSNILNEIFDITTKKNELVCCTPQYNVIENDKEYVIEMVLAGIKKEDISIENDKNLLNIKAERKKSLDIEYNREEIYYGCYQKTFNLPNNVDLDNIDASMENGILKILIPKQKTDKKKNLIEIK
jgi:HSP20 family protein